LRTRVPQNLITLDRFFSQIEDPAWLPLLHHDGTFATAPEPTPDEENGAWIVQPWPASRYLARMALRPDLQDEVARIALAISPTRNFRVHEDLADVAIALPPHLALRFLDSARTWCADPSFSRLSDKIAALIERFLAAGEIDAALQLSEALLDPDNRAPASLESGYEAWEYGQAVTALLPSLVTAAGPRALALLTTCLLKFRRSGRGSSRLEMENYSYIWRPAIENHRQNLHSNDARQTLIDAVRDGAISLCTEDPAMVRIIVEQLEAEESPLLGRIALHLLSVAPDVPTDLIADRLLDRARLHDIDSWHEYTLLARSRLAELSPDQQAQIVGWAVDDALERARDTRPGPGEEAEDAQVAALRSRRYEHRALERFRGVVPAVFQARHLELVRDFGQAEHPDFLTYNGEVWIGERSPRGADELEALSPEDLVTFLRSWEPSPSDLHPMRPSREGLAQELRALVARQPERFAQTAASFRELHPLYVSSLISGLVEAARSRRPFEWHPLLALCSWVVLQPAAGEPTDDNGFRGDPWANTRSDTARLLEQSFQTEPRELPYEHRAEVWSILERLTSDSDPTPLREAGFFASNSSAYDLAINSTRGTALEAAIQYGLWVRRNTLENYTDFETMPELRRVLERHLEPAIESSIAVRSVYGRWLPWLHLLDPAWASAHLRRILPEGSEEAELRRQAWKAYVLYCRPYTDVFPLLVEAYGQAVEELERPDSNARRSPDEHLADHLMVYLLRGQLAPDSVLVTSFFDRAGPVLRGHALRFVGRVLRDNDDLDADTKARALALWEVRIENLDREPLADVDPEREAFGWWFAATAIDSHWRVSQLERVLSRCPRIEPDHLVFEQFVALVATYPLEVLRGIRQMIEHATDRWKIFSWRKELRQILEAALRSEDVEVIRNARAIVSLLVARGEIEFRTLLNPREP